MTNDDILKLAIEHGLLNYVGEGSITYFAAALTEPLEARIKELEAERAEVRRKVLLEAVELMNYNVDVNKLRRLINAIEVTK
jgi:hypothetical protein